MRPLLYARTLNLLVPRRSLAGVPILVLLLLFFFLGTNSKLEVHLATFSTLIFASAVFAGLMLLGIARAPLSFCLPNQQRVLRPVVMIVGLGICIGLTALTLKLMALNRHHALYTEFLSGPAFELLLLQGLTHFFRVLSLLLLLTFLTTKKWSVATGLLFVLWLFVLLCSDVERSDGLAIRAMGAAASAALCWWLLGLRSVARQVCQGVSVAPVAPFQFNLWRGGAVESLMLSCIRRFGSYPLRGGLFESLYLTLNGATARNVLFALLACLYGAGSMALNYQETPNTTRLYDFYVLPLIPLCFPIFRMKTMFSPWLPISRVQRFVQLLLQGAFHYLLALLMVLLVRAMLSLLVWAFPDEIWNGYAQNTVYMPLKIMFLCGLVALVANFFHTAVPTIPAVICMLLIGAFCYAAARELATNFFELDLVDIVLVSVLTCVPFVLACAYRSFRSDLHEGKNAWTN